MSTRAVRVFCRFAYNRQCLAGTLSSGDREARSIGEVLFVLPPKRLWQNLQPKLRNQSQPHRQNLKQKRLRLSLKLNRLKRRQRKLRHSPKSLRPNPLQKKRPQSNLCPNLQPNLPRQHQRPKPLQRPRISRRPNRQVKKRPRQLRPNWLRRLRLLSLPSRPGQKHLQRRLGKQPPSPPHQRQQPQNRQKLLLQGKQPRGRQRLQKRRQRLQKLLQENRLLENPL